MSSFLEICQRTARELEIPGVGPSSVVGQVGQELQIVRWVDTSVREIERKHANWKFMLRLAATFNTVVDQRDYILTTGLGFTDYKRVDPDSIKYFKVSDGVAYEQPLVKITWKEWTDNYRLAYTAVDANAPAFLVELPDGITWRLSAKSDAIYTITFDYYRNPQKPLTATDPDLPANTLYIPEQYEDAIVGSAMMKYGRQYEAKDKLEDGKELYKPAMADMTVEQLPFFELADSLGHEQKVNYNNIRRRFEFSSVTTKGKTRRTDISVKF